MATVCWAGQVTRTGGQINRELVFGEAVGVAHWGHLGAHVMTPPGLFIQCGAVCVSRITVHLKVFRLSATLAAARRVAAVRGGSLIGGGVGVDGRLTAARFGLGGRCAGAGLVQQLIEDLAVGGVGRRHGPRR